MATFTLDTSTLSGDLEQTDVVVQDRGRTLQLTWAQGGANQDMEVYGYAVRYFPAEDASDATQTNVFATNDWAFIETPVEDRGRALQLTWSLGGTNQDIELFGHAIRFWPGEAMSNETA